MVLKIYSDHYLITNWICQVAYPLRSGSAFTLFVQREGRSSVKLEAADLIAVIQHTIRVWNLPWKCSLYSIALHSSLVGRLCLSSTTYGKQSADLKRIAFGVWIAKGFSQLALEGNYVTGLII